MVDHGFHECSDTWDDSGDLVGDGSNELLGAATQGVGAEEEEARKEEFVFLAELSDSLRDGRLSRPSGTVEPHNKSIVVDLLHNPVHDLVQNGLAGVFVASRRIAAL